MKEWLPAICLIVIFALFQLAGHFVPGWPTGFQPHLALIFCAMAVLRGRQWWGVILAWLVSWPFLSNLQGYGWSLALLATITGIACVFGIGAVFRKWRSPLALLSGVTLSALAFYLVTNTFSFFTLTHIYPRSLQGFLEAQWTGPSLPGFGPTWVFLRNSVGGGLFFASLFLASGLLERGIEAEADDTEEESADEPEEAPTS